MEVNKTKTTSPETSESSEAQVKNMMKRTKIRMGAGARQSDSLDTDSEGQPEISKSDDLFRMP